MRTYASFSKVTAWYSIWFVSESNLYFHKAPVLIPKFCDYSVGIRRINKYSLNYMLQQLTLHICGSAEQFLRNNIARSLFSPKNPLLVALRTWCFSSTFFHLGSGNAKSSNRIATPDFHCHYYTRNIHWSQWCKCLHLCNTVYIHPRWNIPHCIINCCFFC